jgi:hypothetical protein
MVTCDFTIHLRVHDHTTWLWRCLGDGLWTLYFELSQFHGHGSWLVCEVALRARDHSTSSTLVGGKGGAGPSSLHAMLEGPTEYVNARWM